MVWHPKKSRHSPTASDEDLLRQCQQGDLDAWAVLLERHTDRIYAKAREYGRLARTWLPADDWEDDEADLYLFMAETLYRSLRSYQGRCTPATWISAVIGNRQHIIKAYLLHKRPQTAELRLPKALQNGPASDREIFKRLVWGLEPSLIALDLGLPEGHCFAVEDRLKKHSPRVYERILTNRQARKPTLRIDLQESDEMGHGLQIIAADSDPSQRLEAHMQEDMLHDALASSLHGLSSAQRRVLILLYNQSLTVAAIVARAADDPFIGLGEAVDLNRVYYLKDKALDAIAAHVLKQFGTAQLAPARRRELLKRLEEVLHQQGLPPDRL